MSEPEDGIEEGTIQGLTVKIDRYLCVGFGDCIERPSTPFVFDDEGIATFRDGGEAVEAQDLLDACDACPVDALTVLDPDGSQLVP